jgi:ribosomal protein S18 acetylase RimI-like enzyme
MICNKCGLPGEHNFPCQIVKLICRGDSNYDLFWGGYQSDLIVGEVNLCKSKNDDLYLSNFIILPKYRRQGFATRMLQEVVGIAKQKRCDKLRLLVSPENTVAISFYEKNGFQQTGKKFNYLVYERAL